MDDLLAFSSLHQCMPNMVRGMYKFVLCTITFGYAASCPGVRPRRYWIYTLKLLSMKWLKCLKKLRISWNFVGNVNSFFFLNISLMLGFTSSPRWCHSMNSFHIAKCSLLTVMILSLLFTSAGPFTVFPSFSGLIL